MSIFDRQPEEKTDFDRIGVNHIRPYKYQGKWVFTKDGQTYEMAPAGMTDAVLAPMIVGADRLITAAAAMKNIRNPEEGFDLLFSDSYFPTCDVKFSFREDRFDGWVYDVEGVNMAGVMPDQQAWICPYMKLYYPTPPRTLYLKVEGLLS